MSALVGAYVCPRGAWFVEVKQRRNGIEILRSFEHPASLPSAAHAVHHLTSALVTSGLSRAEVVVVVRGFELAHHTLGFPPARDAMLGPIIEREVKRLEPQLTEPMVGWTPVPDDDPTSPDHPPQRQFIVAAIPSALAELFEAGLRDAGCTLLHFTALPAAVQRVSEEFDPGRSATALLLPLPDGLFLGMFLGGGLRIAIEPPLQEHDAPDGAAMAEEAELGATYVRQQFRGAQVERALIAGPAGLWSDTQTLLTERLGVPVERMDINGLSAASIAALGGILDARSPAPLALAGRIAHRKEHQARATLRQTSIAAVAAAAIVAGWAVFQAVDARRADDRLRDARRRVELLGANVGPLRQTAEQRRLVRDANSLARISASDRVQLQDMLAAVSRGIAGPIRLDSLHLERGGAGWIAALAGSAHGTTSGGAVQALHDFYRDLPRRLAIEELGLEQMAYVDTTDTDGRARVNFQLSFVVPGRKD